MGLTGPSCHLSDPSYLSGCGEGAGPSKFKKAGSSVGTYSRTFQEGPEHLYVIEGECPTITPTPAPPTDKIVGHVAVAPNNVIIPGVATNYKPRNYTVESNFSKSLAESDLIPIVSVPLAKDGSYTFTNVTPGDYVVKFSGDGITFDPPSVEVSVYEGEVAQSPSIESTQIQYIDAGCKISDSAKKITSAVASAKVLKDSLSLLVPYYSKLAQQKLTGAKRKSYVKKLTVASQKVEKNYGRLFSSSLRLPLAIRLSCPKVNNCKVKTVKRRCLTRTSLRPSIRLYSMSSLQAAQPFQRKRIWLLTRKPLRMS